MLRGATGNGARLIATTKWDVQSTCIQEKKLAGQSATGIVFLIQAGKQSASSTKSGPIQLFAGEETLEELIQCTLILWHQLQNQLEHIKAVRFKHAFKLS